MVADVGVAAGVGDAVGAVDAVGDEEAAGISGVNARGRSCIGDTVAATVARTD